MEVPAGNGILVVHWASEPPQPDNLPLNSEPIPSVQKSICRIDNIINISVSGFLRLAPNTPHKYEQGEE